MSTQPPLLDKLQPFLKFVAELDLNDTESALTRLEEAFPVGGPAVEEIGRLLREGVSSGELCDRENAGARFSRLKKAAADTPGDISIDLVHMSAPGPGHTHPNGEVDLCFAVEGTPTFDGRAPGWTVYPRGSWHVPTVSGGVMDIIYFLPDGAIRFEPKPE